MASDGTEPQTGRETRFLVLVVVVAVAVLLLLAQFRFPGSDLSVVTPGTAPFAGLAARATFDEMAGTLADVIGRVSPLTVAVPLAPPVVADQADPGLEGTDVPDMDVPPARPHVLGLALRVRRDMALLHVPSGLSLQAGADPTLEVVAHDEEREMMLLRVSPSNVAPDTLSAAIRTFPSFAYAVAVSATPAGPTLQPVFLGRADAVNDARWSHALVPATAGPGLAPGMWLFSLDGRLEGVVVDGDDGAMVVPAPALETLVLALADREVVSP